MKKFVRPSLLAFALAAPTLPVALQSSAFAQPEQNVASQVSQAAGTIAGPWTNEGAQQLLAYVEQVGLDGLTPASYGPDRLRAAIGSGDEAARTRIADEIFLKLAADISGGSVRGGDRVSWYMAPSGADDAERQRLLSRAKRGNVTEVLNGLLPTHAQYGLLKRALANPANAERRDLIRTNMERWRWLPRNLGERHIIVNVPAYTAAIIDNGEVTARHRAVVGATSTPTPQLSATVTAVTFNPWWTVPQSIVRTMRGFGGYEVRNGNGYRIVRQPPGPRNALGRIKIEMPNEHAIYLHDTPSRHLFSRPVRAFSHGCIRTDNVREFARLLLAPTNRWDRPQIDRTIDAGRTVQARLAAPIPVYIAYFTAAANIQGEIVTYADIYGRDGRVRQALNRAPGSRSLASGS
ncbi:MAG TPA: L,D-transpeptidase family protein [Allosphingosinicella sp.]